MSVETASLPARNVLVILGIVLYTLLFYFIGRENLYLGYTVVLGVLSFPFLIQVGQQRSNYMYLAAACLAAFGAYLSGSFTFYYFTFAFGLCFILTVFYGRINNLPIFLLLIISPLIAHITAILSFPIRLWLSEGVSTSLSAIGFDIVSEGNLLLISGARFLVDQECVGLKMLLTGLVLTLIVLAYFEYKHKKQFTFWQIVLALVFGFAFNVFANFSRILLLVLFKIGPEKALHELIGIACLLLYNIVPLIFIIRRWTVAGKNIQPISNVRQWNFKSLAYMGMLTGLLGVAGWSLHNSNVILSSEVSNVLLDNLNKEELADNILKYSNEDLLIYVKPPSSPFRGTHDPRFCWRGSGYELKLIKEELQNGYLIYTGELIKGEDKIYTAWWYQDGPSITNSEWSWRTSSVLDSKSYALININAETKAVLTEAVRQYLAEVVK